MAKKLAKLPFDPSATFAGRSTTYAFIRNPATFSVLSCLILSPGEPMRRRSDAGGELTKTRRRKAPALKRRNGPKAVRRRGSPAGGQETNVERLARERDEALEQTEINCRDSWRHQPIQTRTAAHPTECRRHGGAALLRRNSRDFPIRKRPLPLRSRLQSRPDISGN